jgi:hypothetical protein
MKLQQLLFISALSAVSFFSYAGNGDKTESKEVEAPATALKMDLEWFVVDDGTELKGTVVRVYEGDQLLMEEKSVNGVLNTQLPINKIYRIEVIKDGYVDKMIKLATFANPKTFTNEPTEMVVDMLSDNELLKFQHIEQVVREEVLMYNDKEEVFVPSDIYTEVLEHRFERLTKRKAKKTQEPTQKIKS